MADVFISYARPDEPQATRVADALRSKGYGVWRDDELPAHRAYADVIQERLNAADVVVVLWSADAAKSQWVRAEADTARSSQTLVQASLDGTVPPIPFNQIHCAQLQDWDGATDGPGWRKLEASVNAVGGEPPAPADPGANRHSARELCICVLPFQNMSGDPEQEYFSDGISEDITTDLSKISALGVVARNTAFTFKARSVDVCEVAQKLGVSHVLEGSVRKAGQRVRINAQLIDGASGDHVWADRYDRDLDNIFDIQDEISKAIVGALKLKLLPQEKKAIEAHDTTNVEAYKLYLLARQYWVTGNHGDIRREERVMRICSRAVEIDPYYARAWALLAIAQSNLRYGFRCQVDDGVAAAHAALSIDSSIAEAHCPKVRRLEEQGLISEADEEMDVALRLDPDSWEVNKEAARVFFRKRRLDEAVKYLETAVRLMESDVHAWARLMTCYRALGDRETERTVAATLVEKAERVLCQDPSNGAAMSFAAAGHASLGEADGAREWMERAFLVDPDNLIMRFNFACILATDLDDKEAAVKLLDRHFRTAGAFQVNMAEADPDLDGLRDDPKFQAMLARTRKRLGMETQPDRPALAANAGQLASASMATMAPPR